MMPRRCPNGWSASDIVRGEGGGSLTPDGAPALLNVLKTAIRPKRPVECLNSQDLSAVGKKPAHKAARGSGAKAKAQVTGEDKVAKAKTLKVAKEKVLEEAKMKPVRETKVNSMKEAKTRVGTTANTMEGVKSGPVKEAKAEITKKRDKNEPVEPQLVEVKEPKVGKATRRRSECMS